MGRNHKNYIPLSKEMLTQLRSLKSQTGMGAIALRKFMLQAAMIEDSSKLSVKKIDSWFAGTCNSVAPEDFDLVITAYKNALNIDNAAQPHGNIGERIEITEKLRQRVNELLEHTSNIGIDALLKRSGAPKGLSANQVHNIRRAKVDTIRLDHAQHLESLFKRFSIE